MMKLCILAFLPLAAAFVEVEVEVATNFDLHEHPIVESALGDLEEHWSEFRALVTEHLQPHHLPLHTFVPPNTDTCGVCLQGGTKFLMEHAMKKMQDKCNATTASNQLQDPHKPMRACVFGKVCTWMSKHPKVAMGLMFEHLRPMSLMQAYCTGKGTCDKPDDATMSEILSGHQPHAALLKNFDQIDWTTALEEASDLVPKRNFAKNLQTPQTPKCESDQKSKVCPRCMMKGIRIVTMKAVMKIKAMCQETKCPTMMKMCPWMKENREVSLGMILSKVEPWKFAKGWCMHRQRMHKQRGWHHHGDHEHGHGHEHGDWHHEHHHGDDHHDHHEHGFKGGIWGHFRKVKDELVRLIHI